MKRSYFLKALAGIPLGGFLVRFLQHHESKERYLLNKFYVAGFQYYEGPSIIESISAGENLALRADPNNTYDNFAVAIYRKGVMLGHVPRSENKHISRLLQQGAKLSCKVRDANPENETWEMVLVETFMAG